MTTQVFTWLFLLGAAALAVWIHVRWPQLTPSKLVAVLLHVAAATAAAAACGGVVSLVAEPGTIATAFAAVFLVALPVLVYVLLTALWTMTALRSAM